MVQQSDGNLVLYRTTDGKEIWATFANGAYAVMQGDGNFVQYNDSGVAVWNSGTCGDPNNANYKLSVSNSGPVYTQDGNPGTYLWAEPSTTACPT